LPRNSDSILFLIFFYQLNQSFISVIAFGVGVAGVAALIGTGPAATAAVEEVAVAGETEAVTPLAGLFYEGPW